MIEFECTNLGGPGGLISTIDYKVWKYSTTNPIDDGYFKLIKNQTHQVQPLEYSIWGSSTWLAATSDDIENDAADLGWTRTQHINISI